jgi:hypothetical protein
MNPNTLKIINTCKELQQELDSKCNECRDIVKHNIDIGESIWHSSLDFYNILFKEQFDELNWNSLSDKEKYEILMNDDISFKLKMFAFEEDLKQRHGWL